MHTDVPAKPPVSNDYFYQLYYFSFSSLEDSVFQHILCLSRHRAKADGVVCFIIYLCISNVKGPVFKNISATGAFLLYFPTSSFSKTSKQSVLSVKLTWVSLAKYSCLLHINEESGNPENEKPCLALFVCCCFSPPDWSGA